MFHLDKKTGPNRDGERPGEFVNPWEVIGGLIKYFRLSWDEILWERSWANITMLMLSIPKHEDKHNDDAIEITDISEFGDLLS